MKPMMSYGKLKNNEQKRNSGGIGDGWERIYVAAQANSSGALTLTVEASGFGGSFYVDDLQLETSRPVSRPV